MPLCCSIAINADCIFCMWFYSHPLWYFHILFTNYFLVNFSLALLTEILLICIQLLLLSFQNLHSSSVHYLQSKYVANTCFMYINKLICEIVFAESDSEKWRGSIFITSLTVTLATLVSSVVLLIVCAFLCPRRRSHDVSRAVVFLNVLLFYIKILVLLMHCIGSIVCLTNWFNFSRCWQHCCSLSFILR